MGASLFAIVAVRVFVLVGRLITRCTEFFRHRARSSARARNNESACCVRDDLDAACKLGNYELVAKLGAGGMGEVYVARHSMLRRPTAVKLLRQDQTGEESLARFEREVQLTSELTHPNTIRIYDYGRTRRGLFFYAMEHLEGADLATIVSGTGPMDPGRVLHVIAQTADALAEAHERGLIHRDIKPSNIFLLSSFFADGVKVLDFGLVKHVRGGDARAITETDVVAGTPSYMSPETITRPGNVDASSDIYSLGCVAYFLLTGGHVFRGATPVEVCSHHLHSDPAPMNRSLGVSPALEALVRSCLSKSPAARPTTEELLELTRGLGEGAWARWTREDARAWWDDNEGALDRDAKREDLAPTVEGRRRRSQATATPLRVWS